MFTVKTLSLLLCFVLSSSTAFLPTTENDTKVVICTGGSSTKYHASARCNGLHNCKGEIISITKKEATEMNRTPCKICY